MELSHYFAGLGTDVSLLVRSKVLRLIDGECQREFERVFKQHVKVTDGIKAFQQVSYKDGVFTVTIKVCLPL